MMRRARAFPRAERGSVAIETALALVVLIGGFSGLAHLVGDVFADDRMARGARAAARTVALDAAASPWRALQAEGLLASGAQCPAWTAASAGAACAGWTLAVARGVSAKRLAAAYGALGAVAEFVGATGPVEGGPAGASGEVVLVRIERGAGAGAKRAAFGLARSEPRS